MKSTNPRFARLNPKERTLDCYRCSKVSKDFLRLFVTPVIFEVYDLRLFVSSKVFLFRASRVLFLPVRSLATKGELVRPFRTTIDKRFVHAEKVLDVGQGSV